MKTSEPTAYTVIGDQLMTCQQLIATYGGLFIFFFLSFQHVMQQIRIIYIYEYILTIISIQYKEYHRLNT